MKKELLDKIRELALESSSEGFHLLGCALARVGAAAAMNLEGEAADVLFPVSQKAADLANPLSN